jgi:predicted peroxiredoxin
MAEKLVIVCTHGPEDPERATLPFVVATAAQASDVNVVMGFQASGVLLAKKGIAEIISAPIFPPSKDLLDAYIEAGGELLVCGPCTDSREINPETEFVKNAKVVNAATFVKEFAEATNVINY